MIRGTQRKQSTVHADTAIHTLQHHLQHHINVRIAFHERRQLTQDGQLQHGVGLQKLLYRRFLHGVFRCVPALVARYRDQCTGDFRTVEGSGVGSLLGIRHDQLADFLHRQIEILGNALQ